MIQSMTGYAAAAAESPRGRLSVELRSVNSRFLDLQFRIADELRALEPLLRERIVAAVSRGKLDCRVYLNEGATSAAVTLDAQMLERLRALAAQAARAFPDATPLRIADVLRWPGVVSQAPADDDAMRALALRLIDTALAELAAARAREGAKLAALIRERISAMRRRVEEVVPRIPEAVRNYEAKLLDRLREALGSGQEERIRAEVTLFASKVDVDEELDRLRTHFDEVERVLDEGARRGVPVGKRLDFLAQELNREANTLASKAASGAVADAARELKLLVEQVREQVQNLE